MKKITLLLLLVSSFLFTGTPAFAEHEHGEADAGAEEGRTDKEMMGKMDGKMGRMGMMHQKPVMTVTPDGGVLVLIGNKLAKYDAQLNLIKEVELKGGPGPDKMKWKKMSQEDSGPKPMDDEEIAAMLDEEPPVPASPETPVNQDAIPNR